MDSYKLSASPLPNYRQHLMSNYYIPLNSPRLPHSWNCCFNAPRPPHIRDIPPFPVELEVKPRANTPYWFILPQG